MRWIFLALLLSGCQTFEVVKINYDNAYIEHTPEALLISGPVNIKCKNDNRIQCRPLVNDVFRCDCKEP